MNQLAPLFNLRLHDDKLVAFTRPAIMGIINLSPNSFYRPHINRDSALQAAEEMITAGADILDIGGYATNPAVCLNEQAVSLQAEIDRVIPVIQLIKQRFHILVSIDTSRAAVMQEAVSAGADIVNDQNALQSEEALQTVADLKTPVCLMHCFPENHLPASLPLSVVLNTIKQDLIKSITRCETAGILKERIIIDPGFGQGNYRKNSTENYYLLAHLSKLVQMGYPVLSGWSRKSMIGDLLQQPAEQRLFGSIAADTIAILQGAALLRTHDVLAAKEAMLIAREIKNHA